MCEPVGAGDDGGRYEHHFPPLAGLVDGGLVYLLVVLYRTSFGVAGLDPVRAVFSSTRSSNGGRPGCAQLDEKRSRTGGKNHSIVPLPCGRPGLA